MSELEHKTSQQNDKQHIDRDLWKSSFRPIFHYDLLIDQKQHSSELALFCPSTKASEWMAESNSIC